MSCHAALPFIPYPVDVFTGREIDLTMGESFDGRSVEGINLLCRRESSWNTFLGIVLVGCLVGLFVGFALIFG